MKPTPAKNGPQRFGTMTKLELKSGRAGDYGIITIDCGGKFSQTAFIFNAEALKKKPRQLPPSACRRRACQSLDQGPIESVDRGGFQKDTMKVVYFKDNSAQDEDAAPEAAAPAEPQDLTVLKGIGAAVAEVLNANGVTTYSDLAATSPEALDEMSKGYAASAKRYDWIAQAEALVGETAAAAKAKAELTDEIPF